MTVSAADKAQDNLVAMGLFLCSSVAFACMHAMIKHIATDMHPFEIAFFRNLFGVIVLAPVFLRHGFGPLRTRRPGLMFLRAAINTLTMISFFMALALAPLADVAALNFTAPIFATLLAMLFLGEKVGVRRWAAILAGLAGAMLVLRPGFGTLETGHVLTLFSAICWGVILMIIKILSRTESALTITLYMGLWMTPLSAIPAAFFWTWPDFDLLLWLAAIGVVGTAGQYLVTEALRRGDTTVIMPLDFFKLVWAGVLGVVLFGELPDAFTWAGGAVIFLSATYIALRERRLKKDPGLPVPRTPGQS